MPPSSIVIWAFYIASLAHILLRATSSFVILKLIFAVEHFLTPVTFDTFHWFLLAKMGRRHIPTTVVARYDPTTFPNGRHHERWVWWWPPYLLDSLVSFPNVNFQTFFAWRDQYFLNSKWMQLNSSNLLKEGKQTKESELPTLTLQQEWTLAMSLDRGPISWCDQWEE